MELVSKHAWFSLPVFLSYRLLLGSYFLGIWIWDVSNIQLYPGGKYFIYFTNLTYTFATLYFVYGSILCIIELVRQRRSKKESHDDKGIEMQSATCTVRVPAEWKTQQIPEDELLAHHKIFWFIYVIAASVGLMLSIGYWTVIFNGEPIEIRNITKHVLNVVFMIIETMISRVPVRLYHAVYAIAFSALYIVFTVIYWAVGGTDIDGNPYIYLALDWNNISTTIIIIIPAFLIIVTPLVHLMFYGLHKFRSWLESKYDAKSIVA